MSDPMLPFKLMAPRTVDTTAQTQKDTRTLASGDALQRLKASGAMNLQRQKGMDSIRNTLLGQGINPTQQGLQSGTFSPRVADQIRQFYDTNQVLNRANAISAAVKGGVRLPPQPGPISLRNPLPDFKTNYDLPGVAMEREKGKFVQEAGTKRKGYRHRGTGEYLSPFEGVEESEKSKIEGKAGSPSTAKKSVEKALDVPAMLAKIPPEGVPYVRPNGQVGRLYNRNGKPVFIADQ